MVIDSYQPVGIDDHVTNSALGSMSRVSDLEDLPCHGSMLISHKGYAVVFHKLEMPHHGNRMAEGLS